MFRQIAESVIICIGFLAGAGLIHGLGHPVEMTFAKVSTEISRPGAGGGHAYYSKPQAPVPSKTHPAKTELPKKVAEQLKAAQVDFEEEEKEKLDDIRIFNNRSKVLWLCLGALGGAWCFFAYQLIKTLNFLATSIRLKTTCYITVSFISALFVTPWTLIHFNIPTPEETCAFAGWLSAVLSWGGIEVLTILMRKLGFAAEQGGVGGVTKFLAGQAVTDDKKQPTPGS